MIRRRKPLRRKTPIRRISARQLIQYRQYLKQRAAFLAANVYCECFPCKNRSRDVHHTRGRGRYLLDESTWMAVCRAHHDWIHGHPREAREKEWLR